MDVLSAGTEKKVMEAIKKAIHLANAGEDPSAAIAKAASESQFGKEIACRMVEAFNVSKTLKHVKEAKGLDRASDFAIADPNKVLSIMYPEKVASPAEKAASVAPKQRNESRFFTGIVSLGDAMEKAASAAAKPIPGYTKTEYLLKKAEHAIALARSRCGQAKQKSAEAKDDAVRNLFKIAEYFRVPGHAPFDEVERVGLGSWGQPAKVIFDLVWSGSKSAQMNQKRASENPPSTVAPAKEPYTIIKAAMQSRTEHIRLNHVADFWAAHAASMQKRALSISKKAAAQTEAPSAFHNATAVKMLDTLGRFTGAPAGGASSPYEDSVQKAVGSAIDPSYDAEQRALNAQLMLHDFITQDPILSRQDPNKVLGWYNEVASMAPRAANNPGLMRSLLQRASEAGDFDPMMLNSVLDTEQSLRQAQPLTKRELL